MSEVLKDGVIYDAAVVLSHGSCDTSGNHDEETAQRIAKGVELFQQRRTRKLVMSGNRSFLNKNAKLLPGSVAMRRTAISLGVPGSETLSEMVSLDTIGNALYTKKQILEPHGWNNIILVTSPSHSERGTDIFNFVLGDGYTVTPAPAAEAARQAQGSYEFIGTAMERVVLGGLEPGDDEAIEWRLKHHIPGYGDSSLPRLALNGFMAMPRLIQPISFAPNLTQTA